MMIAQQRHHTDETENEWDRLDYGATVSSLATTDSSGDGDERSCDVGAPPNRLRRVVSSVASSNNTPSKHTS
ncbi:hypothetical protein KIN20_024681 [Parelaphostrongylus tenuis]|uniref:Uncharacterized protein n=1 Tax=Parelaphostrongylus tenuis TaxID=148309 RepID=A0AAD5NCY4_PARTN|nr:hypothetical protein KIN20_024681 [Parelaphostrongylus tenuis]